SAGAARLFADRKVDRAEPHHIPRSRNSARRNIVVTLCGDRRGTRPMHRICISGNDAPGRKALEAAGFSVRAAKRSDANWVVETVRADFGEAATLAESARRAVDGRIILKANLHGRSLPFISAASVQRGMVMINGQGGVEIVEGVRRIPGRRQPVFDL